jgi:hypothetical protein
MSVFKKIFGKDKEKKDANFSLGTPTGFKHVGHVGYDPDKGSLEVRYRRQFHQRI